MQENINSDSDADTSEKDFEHALDFAASSSAKASEILKIFQLPSISDDFQKKREILKVFQAFHPEQKNGIEILRKWVYDSYSNEAYSDVIRLTPPRLSQLGKSAETHGFVGMLKKLAEKIALKYNL